MKLTVLLFLLFCSSGVFSQKFNTPIKPYKEGTPIFSPEFNRAKTKVRTFGIHEVVRNYEDANVNQDVLETEFFRFCMNQRFKELRKFHICSAVSASFLMVPLSASVFAPDMELITFNKLAAVSVSGSLLAGILSLYYYIDSDKWLRYSSIKPSRDGIGVVITF